MAGFNGHFSWLHGGGVGLLALRIPQSDEGADERAGVLAAKPLLPFAGSLCKHHEVWGQVATLGFLHDTIAVDGQCGSVMEEIDVPVLEAVSDLVRLGFPLDTGMLPHLVGELSANAGRACALQPTLGTIDGMLRRPNLCDTDFWRVRIPHPAAISPLPAISTLLGLLSALPTLPPGTRLAVEVLQSAVQASCPPLQCAAALDAALLSLAQAGTAPSTLLQVWGVVLQVGVLGGHCLLVHHLLGPTADMLAGGGPRDSLHALWHAMPIMELAGVGGSAGMVALLCGGAAAEAGLMPGGEAVPAGVEADAVALDDEWVLSTAQHAQAALWGAAAGNHAGVITLLCGGAMEDEVEGGGAPPVPPLLAEGLDRALTVAGAAGAVEALRVLLFHPTLRHRYMAYTAQTVLFREVGRSNNDDLILMLIERFPNNDQAILQLVEGVVGSGNLDLVLQIEELCKGVQFQHCGLGFCAATRKRFQLQAFSSGSVDMVEWMVGSGVDQVPWAAQLANAVSVTVRHPVLAEWIIGKLGDALPALVAADTVLSTVVSARNIGCEEVAQLWLGAMERHWGADALPSASILHDRAMAAANPGGVDASGSVGPPRATLSKLRASLASAEDGVAQAARLVHRSCSTVLTMYQNKPVEAFMKQCVVAMSLQAVADVLPSAFADQEVVTAAAYAFGHQVGMPSSPMQLGRALPITLAAFMDEGYRRAAAGAGVLIGRGTGEGFGGLPPTPLVSQVLGLPQTEPGYLPCLTALLRAPWGNNENFGYYRTKGGQTEGKSMFVQVAEGMVTAPLFVSAVWRFLAGREEADAVLALQADGPVKQSSPVGPALRRALALARWAGRRRVLMARWAGRGRPIPVAAPGHDDDEVGGAAVAPGVAGGIPPKKSKRPRRSKRTGKRR